MIVFLSLIRGKKTQPGTFAIAQLLSAGFPEEVDSLAQRARVLLALIRITEFMES